MRRETYHIGALIILLALPLSVCLGQDGSARPSVLTEEEKKVQFNGLGRTILSNSTIDGDLLDTDTSTAVKLTDGEFLLDMMINAQPNENTEVQGILRLRNEFGGFFGAGVTVEIRELWARGVIANAVRYRLGDFDYALTPFTFYSPDEEISVNEPAAFEAQRKVIHYEQWYTDDNTRRLQGAKLDFGLEFPTVLNDLELSPFIARIRPTDFVATPTRFVGGGRVGLSTQTIQDSLGLQADLGLNVTNTWDDLKSGDANSGIRNLVWSVDFDVTAYDKDNLSIHITGEAGRSSLEFKDDQESLFDKDDSFVDAGVTVTLKEANLVFSASYLDVGPDFFSAAAQSKRIDFDREKTFFHRIGNDRLVRMPTLFDISRDRALYTFELSDRLLAYDPRYGNVMPYGAATANRTGLKIGVDYEDAKGLFDVGVDGAFLKEIRGQGTFELKDFRQIRAFANVNFHNVADLDKNLRFTLGMQSEQTERAGVEVDQVDFSSNLFEIGIEAEIFTRFDILLGGKFLSANGNEYIPLIEEYNEIRDFPGPYIIDDTEVMLAAGLRYRFKQDVDLTLQYQKFNLKSDLDTANDYGLGQVFALYSMQF